jgi:hypothetical protein
LSSHSGNALGKSCYVTSQFQRERPHCWVKQVE